MQNDDNMDYPRVIKFAEQHILCNQTHVVNTLLKNEKNEYVEAGLHNMYTYTIQPHVDKLKIPEQQFFEKVDNLACELRALKLKRDELLTGNNIKGLQDVLSDIKSLETQLSMYEDAPCEKKEIMEWWVVSFWLSEKLIEKGEAILRALGTSWWGRGTSKRALPVDSIIRQIKTELDQYS